MSLYKLLLIFFIVVVMDVRVERERNITSVRVVWERIDVPGITNYTIYYSAVGNRMTQSEQSVTVSGSKNSIVIMGLLNNVEYQFQVVAIGTVNGQEVVGERSQVNSASSVLIPLSSSCGVSGCLSILALYY